MAGDLPLRGPAPDRLRAAQPAASQPWLPTGAEKSGGCSLCGGDTGPVNGGQGTVFLGIVHGIKDVCLYYIHVYIYIYIYIYTYIYIYIYIYNI